jgi:ABC-2 type transport system ATP-binding protein
VATAASVVRQVVPDEPVVTPEAGGLNVPLADADQAADVLIALRQTEISVASLSVQKPTLDEVFLALTGHGTEDPSPAHGQADRPADQSSGHPDEGDSPTDLTLEVTQ